MKIDLEELEALAREALAIAPGPWTADATDPDFVGLWNSAYPREGPLLGVIGGNRQHPAQQVVLARFIAAARPDIVLALVAALRSARQRASASFAEVRREP